MILETLRLSTRTLHDRLEARVALPWRLASTEAYHVLLRNFYGFYAATEALLAPHQEALEHVCGWSERRKSPLLAADLMVLGESRSALAQLPQAGELPAIITLADALGCLYVLDGATLRGQLIKRDLRTRLAIGPANGGAFFECYGTRIGSMWHTLRQALLAHATGTDREEQIVASAVETFRAFNDWLQERDVMIGSCPFTDQAQRALAGRKPIVHPVTAMAAPDVPARSVNRSLH